VKVRKIQAIVLEKAFLMGDNFSSISHMGSKDTKAEKREVKKKLKMRVSGKGVFKVKEIIIKKSKNKK